MKTFSELTRNEKIDLLTAWIDGETLQVFNGSKWISCQPVAAAMRSYRVKSEQRSQTPPDSASQSGS